jgi:hypothetical protein
MFAAARSTGGVTMQELTTTATLVDYEMLEDGSPITAVLARSELEAALEADESAQLWLELGLDDEDTKLLTVDLDTAALEQMLRIAGGDDILVAFDGMFGRPDVEAHGLRGALVATVAIAAPAGLAAVPQTSEAAATAQRVSIAATAQTADLAATAQVSSLAAKVQVSGVATKTQISKQLVVKAAGLRLLRSGLAR